jgi:hypothetical protein
VTFRTVEHDVVRLDIPMDDAKPMGGGESAGGVAKNACCLVHVQLSHAFETLLQTLSTQQRHNQVRETLGFADGVDRYDVRVTELCDRLRLAAKTLAKDWSFELGAKDLHRDLALELSVERRKDGRETASADLVADVVPRTKGTLKPGALIVPGRRRRAHGSAVLAT